MTTLLAMHGWAGDSRSWTAFAAAAAERSWPCRAGERGYGGQPPREPAWQGDDQQRVLIAHSLGMHLLPAKVLAAAEAVVLLASFGRFIPEGASGRRLRTALAGMRAALTDSSEQARTMLGSFLAEATAPVPLDMLPCTILDEPLQAVGVARLIGDLELLEATTGLPEAFPRDAPCLIVEAGADRIVAPKASHALRGSLPHADRLVLQGAGHALLATPVVPMVMGWIGCIGGQSADEIVERNLCRGTGRQ
jgi:pimeloyl-[acyl-carrier protein] methyl ester esterase